MTQKYHGISLLETIVLVGVLVLALIAGTSMLTVSINTAQKNKNRFMATYLTQECLELARNIRDTAWRQNLPWDCAFEYEGGHNNEFSIKPNSLPANLLSGIKCQKDLSSININCQKDLGVDISLYNNTNEEPIKWSDDTPSKFFRKLTSTKDPTTPEEIKISCETFWETRGGKESIIISEILTNWKK